MGSATDLLLPTKELNSALLRVLTSSPKSLRTIVTKTRRSFGNVDENQIKVAVWRLAGSGVAKFDHAWRVSIPARNKRYALRLIANARG